MDRRAAAAAVSALLALAAYRNPKIGYELSFPSELEFSAAFDGGDLVDRAAKKTVLRTELWPPDECSHAPGENLLVPAKGMAVRRAKDACQADGPNGSSYCAEPIEVKPFASDSGAQGFEITLTRYSESCDTDDDDNCVGPVKKTNDGKKGPVYAFDVSSPRMTRILYIEPGDGTADLRAILRTFKVFKTDPGPKPNCIQDMAPAAGALALPPRK